MKKIKILFAILLMLSSFTFLCSCTALENMKEQHVKYSENSKDVLEYLGNNYYPIDLKGTEYWGDYSTDIIGVVTNHDVPLLLSQLYNDYFIGEYARINDAKSMILAYDESDRYFLREDIYHQYKSMSFDEFFCGYSFNSYTDYEDLSNRIVSAECTAAIRETAAGAPMDSTDLVNYACVGSLNRCDEKGEILLYSFSVFRSEEGKFYLESLDGEQFEVPEKYLSIFEEL